MNNNNLIVLKNITKYFVRSKCKKKTLKSILINRNCLEKDMQKSVICVLDNINMEIKRGEFVGLIGPNGAGKSTILKIISNIYKPSSGSVSVNGSIIPFLELMVGFQPDLSGKDNLYLYGALLGLNRKEINHRYDSILNFSGISKFIDEPLKNLSTGMQTRLAFSLTAHCPADILLIDEVLNTGDEEFQVKCVNKMHELNKNKRTIIFVSHNLDLVEKHCKYVYWIDKGKVKVKGKSRYVIAKYKSEFRK